MKHGSEWYKREPIAFLGGVQGMTAKEHAVYSVVLDLIYQHGGSVNNDPSWFAGWIKDMGSSSVRKTIAELVSREKLFITGDQISQKRAKTEAKTKENLRETRAESGKKGGINSGKSRAGANENKDLTEANVAPREEKRRVDKKKEAIASTKKPTKPRKKPEVPIPENWVPSDKNIADAEDRQFSAKEIEHEADSFRNYHTAKGSLFRDWDAAWRTWLGNARKFGSRRMAGQASTGRHGQGGSIASIVARRWADGSA